MFLYWDIYFNALGVLRAQISLRKHDIRALSNYTLKFSELILYFSSTFSNRVFFLACRKDKPSCKLLYVTPERIANQSFLEILRFLYLKVTFLRLVNLCDEVFIFNVKLPYIVDNNKFKI